jgi:hydrogenase nickel incorporation protein HypB
MCTTCGCEEAVHDHDDQHHHDHHHDHHEILDLEIDVLEKSKRLAADNRAWLAKRGVTMLNLMSSPGAGKTTLLEKTAKHREVLVIEGDQATSFDAERLRAAGAKAIQVNTGAGCHLDPHMVRHALEDLDPPRGSIVFVENVGNLVCPALFDLGEKERVVILSTPEGDDKPLKYPHMFAAASLLVLNKIDLLPHVPFDVERFTRFAREASPKASILRLSAHCGGGIEEWFAWLENVR